MSLLLTLNIFHIFSSVFIAEFEQVNICLLGLKCKKAAFFVLSKFPYIGENGNILAG